MTTTPLIFLVGDSVRGSYQSLLQALFGKQAEVRGPSDNAFDSANTRRRLDEWLGDRPPDIITLNCGLHDIRRDRDTGAHQVRLAEYTANMEAIMIRACERARSRVFVITTTPVIEELHQASKKYDRLNADIMDYNATLKKLAASHRLAVIDLHEVIKAGPATQFIAHDGVHLNDIGRLAATTALAEVLRPCVDEALGISGAEAQNAAVNSSLSFRLE